MQSLSSPVLIAISLVLALLLPVAQTRAAEDSSPPPAKRPLDLQKVEDEITQHYSSAHPEVQEYVRMTANSFGKSGLWLNEDAYSGWTPSQREKRVQYLKSLLNDGEYGRHLCPGLAEASALKDESLIPGLMKVAGYHRVDHDYDCRPKWMAVAALARQESETAVPLLISLVDHGNQNTRMWAAAALARKTKQNFGKDKAAWANWWQAQGHPAVDPQYLEAWQAPPATHGG